MQETPAAQAALSSPQTKCFTSLTQEQELWEELCASPLCQLPAPQQAELWSFVPRSSCPYQHLLQILKFQETTHIWDLFQVVLGGDRNSAIAVAPAPGRVSEGHVWDQLGPRATLQVIGEGQGWTCRSGKSTVHQSTLTCCHISWPCAAKG